MTRVLITGVSGFIGSHLAEACSEADWEVVGIDNFTTYYSPDVKRRNIEELSPAVVTELVAEDLTDAGLDDLLKDVSYVFHLAGQPGVRSSWGTGFSDHLHNNVQATQRLLEACSVASVERVVVASSSSVYGDAETLPTAEDVICRPISPYGATKLLVENLAYSYRRTREVPTVCLRYFTVYGPRQRPDMAFHRLIDAGLDGTPFTMFGDGKQTRDFTFVSDAVSATISAATAADPGAVYNIGGGARTSMNEVVDIIEGAIGRSLIIERSDVAPGDARHTAADTTAAATQLAYSPTRTLVEGLAEQVAWQRSTLVTP